MLGICANKLIYNHVLMTFSYLQNIPRVTALKHPIFEIVTKAITEANLILPFFEELDNKLSRSNRNRFFLITTLLNNILPNLEDVTIIPNLFTKNYLQQLINTYKTNVGRSKDKEFQVITQKLFETLLNTLKQDHVKDKLKIKVIKRLLFYPGTFIFEKVTKSKLIQNITGCLKNEGVRKLGTIYREVVLATKDKVMNENTSERWWNMDRVYASHLLVKLINHPAIQEDKEWKIEQLLFLMQLGLLTHDFENVGIELADSLKYTFYSALDLKLNKLDDLRFILTSIVRELDNSVSEDNSKLRLPLTTEGFAKWKHTISLMDSIGHKKKKKYVVFHILFLQLNLQIFNNSKLATESLDELYSCYERVHKKKNDNDDDNNTNDPLWIEVIIDLFLNLLSHNSHLLRNIVNCVFPLLCKYLNGTAIHQILSVLDPKNESNPLSRFDDESDSDDDNENDDDDEEEEEEKESESDSDETADEEESNTNDKLRLALHKALGSKVDDDAESVDLDDLDDDEGEKLDEALGQAFKQFKPNLGKQKKQSKDDQTLTHFRVRVLDLIEIYINSTPPMLLSLEIMLPLLQVLEFCIRDNHQKPLQDRVKACLKKLCSLKKFSDFEGITEDVLVSLLQSLLEKGTRNALIIQDIGEKVADSCIFIINCSQIANLENSEKRINQVIVKGLCDFFKRRDCLIPYVLFKNIVQLSWKGILDLVPLLADFIFDQTVRPFRRTQAAELVRIFYNNHRFFSTHSKIKALKKQTTKFLENYLNFFKEFNSNPAEKKIKEKFLSHLFLLLSSIKTCPVENNTFEDWQSLGEAIRECRSQISFSKDTKVAFNKLCKHLNVSNIVQLKQTTLKLNSIEEDESEQKSNKNINGTVPGGKKKLKNKAKASHDDTNPVGEENGLNSKKQKRKKNANINNLKMKKESKALRLESLSEGFGKRKIAWQDMDALEGEATHAKKNKI